MLLKNYTFSKHEFAIHEVVTKEDIAKWHKLQEEQRMPEGGLTVAEAVAQIDKETEEGTKHTVLYYLTWVSVGISTFAATLFFLSRCFKCHFFERRPKIERRIRRTRYSATAPPIATIEEDDSDETNIQQPE